MTAPPEPTAGAASGGTSGGRMFSRDELLGGLPARRASTLLFAIEGETARLVAASRITRSGFASERTSAEREREFLRAISSGGTLPRPPSIAEIERFAAGWTSMVPANDDVRAAIARLMGSKYRFRLSDVPRLRAALGLDTAAVAASYQRLHAAPLTTIYATDLPLRDRFRWWRARQAARIDGMPPIWIAFFLALTEALGIGLLSLPLALAGLGPLPGVLLLLVLGLVNCITVGAMAEAVVRNGSMRYGLAYVSRLVTELIGRAPASVLSIVFAIDAFLAFWFYFLGFGSVLTGATGIPIGVWMAILFAFNILLLRHETLDETVASVVGVGTLTLVLAIVITVVSVANIDTANLAAADGAAGGGVEPAALGVVFGVVLMAFFGHTSSSNSAKLLLGIEPSGRALIVGNVAAMAVVVVLYCVSTFAIIGVLGRTELLETSGTALTPLAARLGPAMGVIAVVYTVLAMGVGSLYITLGAYNQVIERLPEPREDAGPVHSRLSRVVATRRGRLLVGFTPALVVLLLLEGVALVGHGDFVDSVAFAGTVTVPFITGVFPLLLVSAARRRGDYVPGRVVAAFGHPIVVVALLALFVTVVAAHALVWDDAIQRVSALVSAGGALALIAWVVRSGHLRPRAVVEVRVDERHRRTTVTAVADGRLVVPEMHVEPAHAATVAAVELPGGPWSELRVWPHRVTSDGLSMALAAEADIAEPGRLERVPVPSTHEIVIVPVDGSPATVTVTIPAHRSTTTAAPHPG